ncbi:MAG: phosphate-starvation-inducible PsiE family protein [Prochloraceae cyanobacterium]|nr:phosphate-starvation-inducible PsiE family protein [Prochloraceae cyanobacterium]
MLKTSIANVFSHWNIYWQRDKIIRLLENIQDLVIISLCLNLFGVMVIKMGELFLSLMSPLHFQTVTSDILFLLILVEIFRLLIIYLQERRVSMIVAVEVAIVSVLREVVLYGILEISGSQVISICEILLILGAIMLIPTLTEKMKNTKEEEFLPKNSQSIE